MDKKELQDQELNQVTGGTVTLGEEGIACKKCGKIYIPTKHYPDGFLKKKEEHGCHNKTYYYKCPSCGYEWTEGLKVLK